MLNANILKWSDLPKTSSNLPFDEVLKVKLSEILLQPCLFLQENHN